MADDVALHDFAPDYLAEEDVYASDPFYATLPEDAEETPPEGLQGRPSARQIAEVANVRNSAQIRRLFFAGIISSLLLLTALAIRDFISGTIEDLYPKGGVKNRLIVLAIVVGVALFLVLIIYESELDI